MVALIDVLLVCVYIQMHRCGLIRRELVLKEGVDLWSLVVALFGKSESHHRHPLPAAGLVNQTR